MIENKDYIYVKKVDINEGITTGTITKASLLFTARYIFVVPFGSLQSLGMTMTTTDYTNTEEFLADLEAKLETATAEEIEQQLLSFLPEDRVFEVAQLKKFSVTVGFWLFGGMRIAKTDGSTKVINVQPKAQRAAIKEFFGMSL